MSNCSHFLQTTSFCSFFFLFFFTAESNSHVYMCHDVLILDIVYNTPVNVDMLFLGKITLVIRDLDLLICKTKT